MRLYNATSCTPYSSTLDGSTARRQPEPRSFVPPPMVKDGERVPLAKVSQRDEQRGSPGSMKEPRHRYRQLKKIPSSNTSTTGGLTPLFDNTGSSSPLSSPSPSSGEENRKSPTKQDRVGVPDKTSTETRIGMPRLAVSRRSDYYYGKHFTSEHETDGIADLDITEDDIESSCSTLTTTRSMMLQQQECTITVPSTTGTRPTEGKKSQFRSNPVVQRGKIQGDRSAVVKSDVSQRRYQPVDVSAHLPAAVCTARKLASVPTINNAKIIVPQKVPIKHKNSSPFATTLHQIKAPARPFAATSMAGSSENTEPPETRNVQGTLLRVENCENGDVGSVKEGPGEKELALQSERVDFFPLYTPASRVIGKQSSSDGPVLPRLGVTSKFPSRQLQPAEMPRESVEKEWDPLYVDADDGPNSAFGEGKPLTWATLSFEDLISNPSNTDASANSGSHIFACSDPGSACSSEATDTFALLENIAINTESFDGGRPGVDQDRKNTGDTSTRKMNLAWQRRVSRAQKRQPRREPSKKPQRLLGPLLERSYWLRLKDKTKPGYATGDKNPQEAQAMERSFEQVMAENVSNIPGGWPAKDTDMEPTNGIKSKEDWWTVPPCWQEQDVIDSVAGPGRELQEDSKGGMSTKGLNNIKVLSPRRVNESHAVLDSISMETNKILSVIDKADAMSPLTLEQILGLRSIVPTPVEERMLITHLKSARKTSASIVFPSKGERFALELIGLRQCRRKLEAIMFQLEFNGVVQRMMKDMYRLKSKCDKLRKRLDEILYLGKEMPLIDLTAEQQSWEAMKRDVEQLEDKFEDFRKFAVALSISMRQSKATTRKELPDDYHDDDKLTLEAEIDLLQETSIGRFAADSCLLLAELYEAFDATALSVNQLCSKEQDGRSLKPAR